MYSTQLWQPQDNLRTAVSLLVFRFETTTKLELVVHEFVIERYSHLPETMSEYASRQEHTHGQ
jgi:hypothetical protein